MKAVVRSKPGVLELAEVQQPVPGSGQVLVRSLRCGICGSDLHALDHFEHMFSVIPGRQPAKGKVVFGHQFCAQIVDYGPDTSRRLSIGSNVVSMPYARGPSGMELVGYSDKLPGGFGEYMVLEEMLLLPVASTLSIPDAAMVEPLAVAEHAVNAARFSDKSVAMVVGCGPIGLTVIASLKARGFGPVIAADFSERRRRAAEILGADVVVDPGKDSPHSRWSDFNVPTTIEALAVARYVGTPADAVIFECVGRKGLLQSLMVDGPPGAQIIVVGVCMETDQFEPILASAKEINLRFVNAYNASEFSSALSNLTEGRINTTPMISSTVGLAGVADAFRRLRDPEAEVTVLIQPDKV